MATIKKESDFVRIDARVPKHVKTALEEAAHIQGVSRTDFMVSVISSAANRIIRENGIIQLCLQDQNRRFAAK